MKPEYPLAWGEHSNSIQKDHNLNFGPICNCATVPTCSLIFPIIKNLHETKGRKFKDHKNIINDAFCATFIIPLKKLAHFDGKFF